MLHDSGGQTAGGIANLVLHRRIAVERQMVGGVGLPITNVAVNFRVAAGRTSFMNFNQSESERRTFSTPATSPCTMTEKARPARWRG